MRRDPLSLVEPAATAPVTQAAAFVHDLKPSLGVLRCPLGPVSHRCLRVPRLSVPGLPCTVSQLPRLLHAHVNPPRLTFQGRCCLGQEEEAKAAHLGVRWRPTESSR